MTHAIDVETPAFVSVSTICPLCGIAQFIGVTLSAELVTGDDGSELKVKAKSKGVDHACGQLTLTNVTPEAAGQVGMDDALSRALDQVVDEVNAGALDDPETGTKVTARRGGKAE